MRGYAGENGGERAQSERVVIGYGDVMLAPYAGQSHVTARLTCDAVSQALKALDQVRPDRSRGSLMRPALPRV